MPLLADVAVEKRMWVQNFIGFSDLTSRACLRISFMSRTTGTAKSKRCRAYSDEFPGAVVVSDMLKERLDDVPVITHLSARGSNELERRDILAASVYELTHRAPGSRRAAGSRSTRTECPRICWHTIVICGNPQQYGKPMKQRGFLPRSGGHSSRCWCQQDSVFPPGKPCFAVDGEAAAADRLAVSRHHKPA